MVTVFYPARNVRGYPVAPQMTEGAAKTLPHVDPLFHRELPTRGVNWAATTTHSHTGAPALPARRPVLLYSPGGGDPRTLGTGLAEELASHGYVVVTIDHPGDASEVEFPHRMKGRKKVRTTVLRGDARTDPALFRRMIDTRIADTRFVLNQLEALAAGRNPDAERRPLPQGLGRALDLRRTGLYGHSAGGTTAAQAMYEDRRIVAAVNLEGFLDHPPEAPGREGKLYPVARYGVDRPLLLLSTDGFRYQKELERSWSAMLAHPHGRTHAASARPRHTRGVHRLRHHRPPAAIRRADDRRQPEQAGRRHRPRRVRSPPARLRALLLRPASARGLTAVGGKAEGRAHRGTAKAFAVPRRSTPTPRPELRQCDRKNA